MPDLAPSPSAANGHAGGREVIAWLHNWREPEKLRANRIFDGYWRGATDMAARFNCELEEHFVGPEAPLSEVTRVLALRNVRAMLDSTWPNLRWTRGSVFLRS